MQRSGRRLWQRCTYRQLSSSSGRGRDDGEILSPAKAGRLGHQLRKNLDDAKNRNESLSLSTMLSHAGLSSSSDGISNAPLSPPINLATTYERPADSNYGEDGLIYSRSCNPTRKLLEDAIGQLEANHGQIARTFAFSSGMAAVASLILAQKAPVKVLVPEDIYHGVPTQLHVCLNDHGIVHESVDMTNTWDVRETIEHHIESKSNKSDGTLVVWIETPSNPLTQVTDIQSICELVDDIRCQDENANSYSC